MASLFEFKEKPKGEALESMRVDTTGLGLSAVDAAANRFFGFDGHLCF